VSNWQGVPTISDGEILTGAKWNALINGLLDFLNNANLGNGNISALLSERIKSRKIDFSDATGGHASEHEPGGVDEVNDIDLGGTGTPATLHASRHADGGADPIGTSALTGAMFKDATFAEGKLERGRRRDGVTRTNFGLTFASEPWTLYTLSPATAYPNGRGVVRVRSGVPYLYFGCFGNDSIVEVNISTGAAVMLPGAGADPRDLLLIGTDIYYITEAGVELKKLDIDNVITSVFSWNSGAGSGHAAVRGLAVNSDATVVYTTGDKGDGIFTHVLRATLSPAVVTHEEDIYPGSGLSQSVGLPMFVKDGANEYIIVVDDRRSAEASRNRAMYRLNAATLAEVDFLDGVISTVNTAHSEVTDGHLIYVNEAATVRVYDPVHATLHQIASFGTPGGNTVNGSTRFSAFFDGRYLCFGAGPDALAAIAPFQYLTGGMTLRCHPTASLAVNGFASDGSSLYVAMSIAATSNASIRRIPL
jgi:hypothetical protein